METSVVTFLAQTGIKFKHVSYGPEPDYWSKVQALHATGQVADVLWASTGNLHNFANRGILAELDPLIAADKYDLSDYVPAGLEFDVPERQVVRHALGRPPGQRRDCCTTSTC